MKMTSFLPTGGPYTLPARLSTFASMLTCTSIDVVRLEKPIVSVEFDSVSSVAR